MDSLREINSITFGGRWQYDLSISGDLGCVCVFGGSGMEIFKDFVLPYF